MWHLIRGSMPELTLKIVDHDDYQATLVHLTLFDYEAKGGISTIRFSVEQTAIPEDKGRPNWDNAEQLVFELNHTDIRLLAAFLDAAVSLIQHSKPPTPEG